MRTKIQQWGDSLAIRIPKPFATEAGLDQQSEVDVSVRDGALVIKPCPKPALTLEDLVSRITDENRHEEIDFGPPVGREIW